MGLSDKSARSLTYKAAGVDIDAGNAFVDCIKPLAKQTYRQGVLGSIGGFGGFFELPKGYETPVLVSGTDGVGTKLKLAIDLNHHSDIGIDLVAMCVNDILVSGAEPLYFLDYYATGHLSVEQGTQIVSGIAKGCIESNCALLGGETAEMPGLYQAGDYDLAGFAVGIVEKSKIIDGSTIEQGDSIIALASNGLHANGFSLARKVIEQENPDLHAPFDQARSLKEVLLAPTALYVKPILSYLKTNQPIKGMAHITGGGLTENIPRILPNNLNAQIETSSWTWPKVFQWLQQSGNIETPEMLKTFNCGVGFVLIVSPAQTASCLEYFQALEINAWKIGSIEAGTREVQFV
jgi:phosphoribosylformylglycinamidine cyclo-ligase